MAALSDQANLQSEGPDFPRFKYSQPASTTLFRGAMTMVNAAGALVPAAATAGNKGVKGMAEKTTINAAGETQDVYVQRGRFRIPHSGLAATNIGETVYAIDDATVGVTAANRPAAGELLSLDGAFAWVLLS